MNIFFQTRKIDLLPDEEIFIARRLENLQKFFSPHVHVYVDIQQSRGGRLGSDLFYVSLKIEDGRFHYFADEYQENLRKAFDHAFGDIFRIIRNDRSRSRRLLKGARRGFKNIFKRNYK